MLEVESLSSRRELKLKGVGGCYVKFEILFPTFRNVEIDFGRQEAGFFYFGDNGSTQFGALLKQASRNVHNILGAI